MNRNFILFYLYILPVKVHIYNTTIQDLTIKLARKPKETIKAYTFRVPYDLQLTYRLTREFNIQTYER